MKKRKRRLKISKPTIIIITLAIVIRIVSSSGLCDWARELLVRAAESDGLIKYAISSETQLAKTKNTDIIERLLSETAMTAAKEARKAEDESEEKRDFPAWKYVPGGEKKEESFPIEEITISPTSEKGYVVYDGIYVKNDSTKGIDLKYLLSAKLPFSLKGKGAEVLIIHTHSSESYFPQGRETYTLTDVERTEDKKYNMIRVGDELEKTLKEAGVEVVHDRNLYDYPTYNGSYTRALDAIGAALKKSPSIKVVIDVHRDSMTTEKGTKYKTVAEVNGAKAAQMMLVMSTGESGLPHPDWAENLKLAIKLQSRIIKKYPKLMRPINLRKERFNMHATTGSMLVEVGTSANSLNEALVSVRVLGEELAEILKTVK